MPLVLTTATPQGVASLAAVPLLTWLTVAVGPDKGAWVSSGFSMSSGRRCSGTTSRPGWAWPPGTRASTVLPRRSENILLLAVEPTGAAALDRDERDASADRMAARAAAVPYALLAIIALSVFLPPALRSWAKTNLLLGPSFPSTGTSQGTANPAVHGYNPIAAMGHPGTFLLLACAASAVVWHVSGVWQRGSWSPIWRGALRQAWKSSSSVVLLAAVAGVLVDSGMVRTVARGAAAATGHAYPAVAPLVGALGSFITGSTTSSNALFSALQRDVALLIGNRPANLLAGQLAGGNIGNSLAPVVILLGLSAVGAARSTGVVLQMTRLPAGVLLASAVLTTWTLVAIHH